LAVVTLFVVVGATRLFSSRKELSSIDITDGIDESEMAIIRSVLLKKNSADKEAAVKAKLAEVSKP
jgi:hypothetical protein